MTAFGSTGSTPAILDDLGEGEGEDCGDEDSMAESASKLRDEGHDFSLMGSTKRLGAIRRAMLVQYRAKTRTRPRKAKTATMLTTIAVIRVVSKPAIVVYLGLICIICAVYEGFIGRRMKMDGDDVSTSCF